MQFQSYSATDRKCLKYSKLSAAYKFQSVAVETHRPLNDTTISFFVDLGRKISERPGKPLFIPVNQCLNSSL